MCAHPPSLYEYGLVAIEKLDIDGRCLDRSDGIGDAIHHLEKVA
jgi:hypothetical protein